MQQAPPFAFLGPGLDRADHRRDDREFLAAAWQRARVWLVDAEGNARFRGNAEAPELLLGEMLAAELPETAIFLGCEGEHAWFAFPHETLPEPLPGRLDLRSAAALWPPLWCAIYAQARALLHWQSRHAWCGACGGRNQFRRGGHVAACAQCGSEQYPRTDTAIIVAVSDGERLLLGRQHSWPEGRWSVLAGFLEPGETLEQAVAREVMEEAGIVVLSARYAASQPWPFPASLMVGFFADAVPAEPQPSQELEVVRWYSRPQLQAALTSGEIKLPPRVSISRWLLECWLQQTVASPPA